MTKKVMLRGGECKLELEDALSYVLMVKETFLYDDEDKYFDFIEIMKDLKKERISYEDVIAQVRSLLKEHPQLLIEFDYFLPPRDRMAGLWSKWSTWTRHKFEITNMFQVNNKSCNKIYPVSTRKRKEGKGEERVINNNKNYQEIVGAFK